MLKRHDFDVNDSTESLIRILGLDDEKGAAISSQFRKINANLKKSKKSPESLLSTTDQWLKGEIPWQPSQNQSSTKTTVKLDAPKVCRKTLLHFVSHNSEGG